LARAASAVESAGVTSTDAINRLDREAFVRQLGGIYEHSPWVAERAWASWPFPTVEALHGAMQSAMLAASPGQQQALVEAHPELLGRLEAAQLTESSRAEQASAGLDRCTAEQKARMRALNAEYRARFGFPFIVAVRGLDWAAIITRMEARLGHDREHEFATALGEIGRIARLRLEALP
jgi:2-oxo-4-hydroxy-4-carboxy-5-ureidoimidazoline decarboxylase